MADRAWLAGLLKAEGIEHWGIVNAGLGAEKAGLQAAYRRWIAEGRHGSMKFLERHEAMKYEPERILAGTQSLICVALGYYRGRQAGPRHSTSGNGTVARIHQQEKNKTPENGENTDSTADTEADAPRHPTGRVSCYATGRDYHRELGGRLKRIAKRLAERYPQDSFRAFTDTAPLSERAFAEKAGLAFTGKNTLSLNSELGSFFFLGEILSTRHFEPETSENEADRHCPRSCTRCLDICPTGALTSPYHIDARRCISYLTIEHKGKIAPELMEKMGNWLFGCDLCQEVCPFNIRAQHTAVKNFSTPIIAGEVNLSAILRMKTHDDLCRIFAGTPVMRAGVQSMIRNAIIAAANTGTQELRAEISRLSQSTDPVISETADWALTDLLKPQCEDC